MQSPIRIVARWTLAAFALSLGSFAWSDCACFCVSGEPQTICSTVEEAQGNPVACPAFSPTTCPEESNATAGASYDAPVDGAVNCRDVRVWDGVRGRYVDVKACDVES